MSSRLLGFVATYLMSFFVRYARHAAEAKDYFLTIGGGYDPSGNQISLEKNVLFQQSVLAVETARQAALSKSGSPMAAILPRRAMPRSEVRRDLPAGAANAGRGLWRRRLRWTLFIAITKCPSLKGPSDLKRVETAVRRFGERSEVGRSRR